MHRAIILTGAAGHLGSTILRQLIHTDCTIRALLYGSEAAAVQDEHIHYYHGDVSDPASLQPLFADLPAEPVHIIHTEAVISIQKHITDIMYRTKAEGVRNMLSLSMSHHITRFIHVSSVHAMPELPMGIMQSEIRTFDPDRVIGGYAKTKAMGAQIIIEQIKDMDAVILMPSGIIGPYDTEKNHLVQMTADYIHGKLPACIRGGYDFTDVKDVADGCVNLSG